MSEPQMVWAIDLSPLHGFASVFDPTRGWVTNVGGLPFSTVFRCLGSPGLGARRRCALTLSHPPRGHWVCHGMGDRFIAPTVVCTGFWFLLVGWFPTLVVGRFFGNAPGFLM